MTASEIVSHVRITQVWRWLGGGDIRHGRARAFYRSGEGWNVCLKDDRGSFTDFVSGDRGGVLDLIVRVQQCSRPEALRWLADQIGASLDDRPLVSRQALADSARIAADALYFADAATVLAEQELEELAANDARRGEWTRLIVRLKRSPEAEYREWWRNGNGKMATGLAHAGQERAKRLQRMLASYLASEAFNGS